MCVVVCQCACRVVSYVSRCKSCLDFLIQFLSLFNFFSVFSILIQDRNQIFPPWHICLLKWNQTGSLFSFPPSLACPAQCLDAPLYMLFHPYLHLPDSPSKLKVHAGFPCLAVILPRFLLNYIAQGETTLATTGLLLHQNIDFPSVRNKPQIPKARRGALLIVSWRHSMKGSSFWMYSTLTLHNTIYKTSCSTC